MRAYLSSDGVGRTGRYKSRGFYVVSCQNYPIHSVCSVALYTLCAVTAAINVEVWGASVAPSLSRPSTPDIFRGEDPLARLNLDLSLLSCAHLLLI